MSKKIEFEQISDDVIEVVIPPETPVVMVQQLTKSLTGRGLIEDTANSTLSVRYFYRPEDKLSNKADELIKSLQRLAKEDELPYWHPKAQMANQKRVREMEIAERRAKLGIPPVAPVTAAPAQTPPVPAAPAAPVPTAPNTLAPTNYTKPFPKMVDTDPANQMTAGGSGKRYAYINDPVEKDEDEDDVEKSGYGPKGGGQYSAVDNARRKSNNLDPVGVGPNVNSKAISTKPGQMSAKASAALTARIQQKANKKQPVKRFTPEEIEAENQKRGLKKAWGQHLPFPSAEEEIMKLAGVSHQNGEEKSAQQLANLLAGKKMLGDIPRNMQHMFADPKPQPTNQELFGHLEVTEEMAKAREQEWSGTLNNFFAEATKPLSQRFASEEEEMAYWNSIKVADRDDGKSGY